MTAPGLPKNNWQAKATGVAESDYRYKSTDQNLVADNIIWVRDELDTKYVVPPTGIPETDLAPAVQVALDGVGPVNVTGSPATGQTLVATSTTTATWQTPAATGGSSLTDDGTGLFIVGTGGSSSLTDDGTGLFIIT